MCKCITLVKEDHQYSTLHISSYFLKHFISPVCKVEAMAACVFCGHTRDDSDAAGSFFRFPLKEEYRRHWIVNMGRDAEWTPSESSSLCSAHFTPECFESGSTQLHPNAIPTLFAFTQVTNLNTECLPQDQRSPTKVSSSCTSASCDCYRRLQATEKNYQLKLSAAQFQIKEYKKNLAEESRKASQWQKRAIVLQSAIRAMKQRGTIPATRRTSTPQNSNVD